MTHTRDHKIFDSLLERVFEYGFLMWPDRPVYAQAVSIWITRCCQ